MDALLWVGGALITVALFGLGLLLVKSDVLLLRVFVGLALPTLVWGVVALLRGSAVSASTVDVVFGGCVALVCARAPGAPWSTTSQHALTQARDHCGESPGAPWGWMRVGHVP